MKPYFKMLSLGTVFALCILFLTSCGKEESVLPGDGSSIDERGPVIASGTGGGKGTGAGTGSGTGTGTGAGSVTSMYGLSDSNHIVTLSAVTPVVETAIVSITGLDVDEKMVSIDVRPTNRVLYGVTDKSMIYTIDPLTGVASRVSTTPFVPAIEGKMVGFDFSFNPDVIRLVTETGQNLTIDPNAGQVISVDNNLSPDFLMVGAIAYSNASFNTTTSGGYGQLFDINSTDGRLYTQLDAKGHAYALHSTGLAITGEGGFDIPSSSFYGFAVLNARTANGVNNSPVPTDDTSVDGYRLYSINTRTGETVSFGPVRAMIGIAVP